MIDVPTPDSPEPRSAPTSGWLFRLQPVITLIIAVTAIGLAVWEGVESRRHNRLTVKPRIAGEINAGRDAGGEYVRTSVESTGLGPAVINTFRVYFDGAVQDTMPTQGTSAWDAVVGAFGTEGTILNAHSIGIGYYFPAGGQATLFEARRPQAAAAGTPLADLLPRLGIQICYCSVYDSDCDEVVLATREVDTLTCRRP